MNRAKKTDVSRWPNQPPRLLCMSLLGRELRCGLTYHGLFRRGMHVVIHLRSSLGGQNGRLAPSPIQKLKRANRACYSRLVSGGPDLATWRHSDLSTKFPLGVGVGRRRRLRHNLWASDSLNAVTISHATNHNPRLTIRNQFIVQIHWRREQFRSGPCPSSPIKNPGLASPIRSSAAWTWPATDRLDEYTRKNYPYFIRE